jgi:hypothetical protein
MFTLGFGHPNIPLKKLSKIPYFIQLFTFIPVTEIFN